jgi:hypothetical protein
MSDNKNKYFIVTKTTIVRARNKAEAQDRSRSVRSRDVLWSDIDVENIAATTAHSFAANS